MGEVKIGVFHALLCVKSLDVEEVVLLQNVITYVSLIYNSAVGDCWRRETEVSKRIDKDIVEVVERFFFS